MGQSERPPIEPRPTSVPAPSPVPPATVFGAAPMGQSVCSKCGAKQDEADSFCPVAAGGVHDWTVGQSETSKHVALVVEIPAIYTDDLDSLREYRGEFESESDWLRNCIAAETHVVRVRLEISGEKDSDVVEVWGHIREAQLVEPATTEEELREHGEHRLLRDERACEWCMTCPEACDD